MSDVIVMGLVCEFLFEGLFDLVDFIVEMGGVFIMFGFDGCIEVFFELGEVVVERFMVESFLWDFVGVVCVFVYVVEYWFYYVVKCFVVVWVVEVVVFFEVVLCEVVVFVMYCVGVGFGIK